MVVVGYGQIIPQSIIDLPPLRHHQRARVAAAEVPRRRADPVGHRAAARRAPASRPCRSMRAWIPATCCSSAETEIGPEETAVELGARLADAGAGPAGRNAARPSGRHDHAENAGQRAGHATRRSSRKKTAGSTGPGRLTTSSTVRAGSCRGPACYTMFRGQQLQIWSARVSPDTDGAWRFWRRSEKRLMAGAGQGSVELLEVQLEGRKRMDAAAFLNGYQVKEGERLG